ncbi:epoxide hydrolase family protein [Paenibacillus sp. FSL R7-0026]|uniref:epoxide hydrolase family protein n=1 Tax=Paenibacillus sp. FSL R7-0026 TaxID=2921668 RepID=UPI0030F527DD
MNDSRKQRTEVADPTLEQIQSFRVSVPQADLDDLKNRLERTRWPDELPGVGWDYGVPLNYVKELVNYWSKNYDWRKHEARLNEFPQFITTIDGENIHFLHVRSPEPNALPLLMIHGWPGSIVEFLNIIDPLTNPRFYGGNPEDAFHLVVPSIPGYGFSGPTQQSGMNIQRIAQMFIVLMERLGYQRYGVQGGDWGSFISQQIGLLNPDHIIGMHLNMLTTFPPEDFKEVESLTKEEKERLEKLKHYDLELSGYMKIQATRPQTLAYALTDSPVGQLAWIVEKFKEWTDSTNLPEDAIDRDDIITNVMHYWLTGTAGSSARLYYETLFKYDPSVENEEISTVPTGVAVFQKDTMLPIRRFAERDHKIIHWSEFKRGGHFAALEQPVLLMNDIKKFFGSFK